MLTHPTLHLLTRLGLTGMAEAFTSLTDNEEAQGLAHAEWLALLLAHEATWRNNRRLALRLGLGARRSRTPTAMRSTHCQRLWRAGGISFTATARPRIADGRQYVALSELQCGANRPICSAVLESSFIKLSRLAEACSKFGRPCCLREGS
ncbi:MULTISPECIES: ATP-binding protein [Bradyrhizobium]|uniref:ATP-binding protein n=1 Tax=Bradyrhizobium pachyrhizi TaxID=280333 RepID=UPI00048693A3